MAFWIFGLAKGQSSARRHAEIASVGADTGIANGVMQFSLRSMVPSDKKERGGDSTPDRVMRKTEHMTSPDAGKKAP